MQFIHDNRYRFKELFLQYDKDQSGYLTRDEFAHGLKESGIRMELVST